MSCLLNYVPIISGDCTNTNSGGFTVEIDGSAPDYTIQWVSPFTGTTSLGVGVTTYTETGLSAGTYTFNIIDSCSPTNTILPVNINISSGTSLSINYVNNTICGEDNGSLTATTENLYGVGSFYLYDNFSGFLSSGTTNNNDIIFDNLSASTYYVIADDGGGCTGKSETVIVQSSTTFDYGFYVVEDAGCAVDSGKIFITGQTGTPPYTYLWSNGGTLDNLTGLTAGTYSVTVTDGSGCDVEKSTYIGEVLPVGFGSFSVVSPTCNSSNGVVTLIITGGTPPFYYQTSNGGNEISFNREITFSGIPSGNFSVTVTDAGLCSFTRSTSVSPSGGLSVLSITKIDSVCDNNGGALNPIRVFGGSPPYVFALTRPNGNITEDVTSSPNWSFNNLTPGDYTLDISDNGPCTFTSGFTINDLSLFGLTLSTTGTTCNVNNGGVRIDITTGGTPPFLYQINGRSFTTTFSSHTFNNLTSGNYTATVTDNNGCLQRELFTIDSSQDVNFTLTSTNANTNSNGSVSAFITKGEPPFILDWVSNNVNGQTGSTVTNLGAGTYTLRVTDDNGCVREKSLTITGSNLITTTQSYNVCTDTFRNYGTLIDKGPKEMLNEGFFDLTSGDTNCVLLSAIFESVVTIGGTSFTEQFYTSDSLSDYPGDNQWLNSIRRKLLSFQGIDSVTYNLSENNIEILTECNYSGATDVNIDLIIYYDIACEVCGPEPTPTPTITPTPTVTSTVTPTPTITPTPGITQSPTPTVTPTPTNTPTLTPTNTPTLTPTPTCDCPQYVVESPTSGFIQVSYKNCEGNRSFVELKAGQGDVFICVSETIMVVNDNDGNYEPTGQCCPKIFT